MSTAPSEMQIAFQAAMKFESDRKAEARTRAFVRLFKIVVVGACLAGIAGVVRFADSVYEQRLENREKHLFKMSEIKRRDAAHLRYQERFDRAKAANQVHKIEPLP